MKTINTFVFSKSSTDLTIFKKTITAFQGFTVEFSNNIESTIEAINARKYDLFIMDKSIEKLDQDKLNKIIDLIYPEVATLDLHMNDEDFIQFKLNSMQQKWAEAHSENVTNFIDNPNLD